MSGDDYLDITSRRICTYPCPRWRCSKRLHMDGQYHSSRCYRHGVLLSEEVQCSSCSRTFSSIEKGLPSRKNSYICHCCSRLICTDCLYNGEIDDEYMKEATRIPSLCICLYCIIHNDPWDTHRVKGCGLPCSRFALYEDNINFDSCDFFESEQGKEYYRCATRIQIAWRTYLRKKKRKHYKNWFQSLQSTIYYVHTIGNPISTTDTPLGLLLRNIAYLPTILRNNILLYAFINPDEPFTFIYCRQKIVIRKEIVQLIRCLQ